MPSQTMNQAVHEAQLDPRQIFTFPCGLYAFENLRGFALLDSTHAPFYWLQSLEHQDLAFLVLPPQMFLSNYKVVEVESEEFQSIEIKGADDPNLLVLSIVTLAEEATTVNLQGPLLLNKEAKLGCQVILNSNSWSVHHDLRDLRESVDIQNPDHTKC